MRLLFIAHNAQFVINRRVDGTGGNGIDANPVGREFLAPDLGEHIHGSLGGTVHRHTDQMIADSRGTDVDDVALAFFQKRQSCLGKRHNAPDIDIKALVVSRKLHFLNVADGRPAGVVDEDVQPAEALLHHLYGAVDILCLRHISHHIAAIFTHSIGGFLQGILMPSRNDDFRAFPCQRLGNGPANAGASGNQSDFVIKL